MHVLDLDLDAFLDGVAHWPEGGRLDAEDFKPWAEDRLRFFLEEQCGLSTSAPIPGRYAENHEAAFDFLRDIFDSNQQLIDLVHVDAHADLGLGQPSWVHMIKENLHFSVVERRDPLRGNDGLNLGSWLAYASAAQWLSSIAYVHPKGEAKDLPALFFRDGNTDGGWMQLKTFDRSKLGGPSDVPDYWKLVEQPGDLVDPPIPFAMANLDEFRAVHRFDCGFLCQSPDYTPETSDALIPIIGEYIAFEWPAKKYM